MLIQQISPYIHICIYRYMDGYICISMTRVYEKNRKEACCCVCVFYMTSVAFLFSSSCGWIDFLGGSGVSTRISAPFFLLLFWREREDEKETETETGETRDGRLVF